MILEYKGVNVFYTDQGTGDVILLLHGFLESSTMWNALIPKITKTHRVVSIDLLGHGRTGCIRYIHTMEDMADAVMAVIGILEIERFTTIGHSMGGYVALALVEKHPKRITGLCLMNSSALSDSKEKRINRDRAIVAVKQNYKTFIGIAVTNLFASDNRTKLQQEINLVKSEALKTPLQGIIAALEGMKMRKDRTTLLKSSKIKKMMIIGRQDPVLEYDALLIQLKNTDTKIVEFSGGHMSHIENKKDFTYKILHFIEK